MNYRLELYWHTIPIGKRNATTYTRLCAEWRMKPRAVRSILHDLSAYDNGDNFVLIRSGKSKGFYKTDDPAEIAAYRDECLKKGRSVFAPVKKCNRVLSADGSQCEMFNNLRGIREARGMKQADVCAEMQKHDHAFNVSLLSKMENGVCLPTFYQLSLLAQIYGVEPQELVRGDFPAYEVFTAI